MRVHLLRVLSMDLVLRNSVLGINTKGNGINTNGNVLTTKCMGKESTYGIIANRNMKDN